VNDYDRLRSIEPNGSGDYVLGNGVKGRSYGIEAWGSYQVNSFWRMSAGLNLLHKRMRFAVGSSDPGSPEAGGNDPRYQFSLRSNWTLHRNVGLDVSLRSVGALPAPHVPSYHAIDARLGWRPRNDLDLSLTAFNLQGGSHAEFGTLPGRSEFGRSVLVRLVWTH
jgi:iron complex outermembrane receptor protein